MARIPDEARQTAPRTATPGYASGGVTDGGLGEIAKGLAALAERRQLQADEQAVAAYGELSTRFDETFKPAAATYDGAEPGFAAAQMASYDATAAEIEGGLDRDAQRSFQRIKLKGRVATFDAAMGVEATAAGARIKEARERAQQLRLVQGFSGFSAGWMSEKSEALQNYTGEQEGFADGLMARFDVRAATAIAAASEEDRPMVELGLANLRADEQLKIQAFELQTRSTWEVETVRSSLETITATVTTNPEFYEQGRAQAIDAVTALGGERAVRLKPKAEQSVAVALFGGMAARGEHGKIVEMLESGDWDERLGDAKPQIYANAQARVDSDADRMTAVTAGARLDAEIASLASTGVSTGFDPSELASIGEAEVAQARQKIAQAKMVYEATKGMEGLTPADRNRRLEAMKPKPGDPDFANRQAAYEMAVRSSQQAQERQAADPALAIQSDPGSAGLWRATAADPDNTAAAVMWANDALIRQSMLGIPPSQQRILPKEEARRVAQSYAKLDKTDAPGRANALRGIYAYAERYGPHSGRVLRELQASGLSASDAAILVLSDGDPVLIGRYTRAIARQTTGKVDANDDKAMRARLQRDIQPFVGSFAGQDGAAFADQASRIAYTIAKSELMDGASPQEAAAAGVAAVTERYVIRNGIRLPRAQLGGTVNVPRPSAIAGGGAVERSQEVLVGDLPGGRSGNLPAELAIMEGARRTALDVVVAPPTRENSGQDRVTGPGLAAAGTRGGLSEDQRRRAYADVVADRGRWVALPDDSGLMLVIPDVRGGVAPVKGRDGKPITRTWAQLRERAKRP